jgi:hypothetical protein
VATVSSPPLMSHSGAGALHDGALPGPAGASGPAGDRHLVALGEGRVALGDYIADRGAQRLDLIGQGIDRLDHVGPSRVTTRAAH